MTSSATGCSPSSGSGSSPRHGYDVPPEIASAGLEDTFVDAMERSGALYDALALDFPEQASYAVSLAYRVRFVMQMNAREAMHVIELRTAPQGHATYRVVCQDMHRLIAEQAGHHAIAAAMRHVDHQDLRARTARGRTGRRGPSGVVLTAGDDPRSRADFSHPR